MRLRKLVALAAFIVVVTITMRMFLALIYVPAILTYHSIDGNEQVTKLSVCPEGFARQMDYFYKHKYNVASLEEIVNLIKEKKRIPPKTISITFDDGLKNNFTCAYPILKKYNFPATIFVITNIIGTEGYVSWDDIKEMDKNNITIGSHTNLHLWLPDLNDEKLKEELVNSKEILEKNLGKKIDFLAYPLGAHDERVKKFARDAGYKAACGTNPGFKKRWDDIYALKRVRISRTSDNMFVLWFETNGYYTLVKEIRDKG